MKNENLKKRPLKKIEKFLEKTEDDFKNIIKLNEISLKGFWENKEDDIWEFYLKK